jgi:hypothetical protein
MGKRSWNPIRCLARKNGKIWHNSNSAEDENKGKKARENKDDSAHENKDDSAHKELESRVLQWLKDSKPPISQ